MPSYKPSIARSRRSFAFALSLTLTTICAAQSVSDISKPVTGLGSIPEPLTPSRVQPIKCPDEMLFAGVNQGQGWYATPAAVRVKSAEMLDANTMVCNYEITLYGKSGRIWRPVAPDFKSCTASGTSFTCVKK
ncbi:MAG: hypothetical protein ACRDAM_11995 [Casimicrobium sp.]